MDIIEKLKKIRNMISDESLTDAERDSWKERYSKLKQQYMISENQIEEKKVFLFRFIAEHKYEKDLLFYIMLSYGMKDVYLPAKKESKNSLRIKCTEAQYELIKDDFNYFKKHFALVLQAATYKFILSHVYSVESSGKKDSELTAEQLKIRRLMSGMDSIEDLNLNRKMQINLE